MLAKKLKARISKDKTIVLHVPDMPQGEVEVVILHTKRQISSIDEILSHVPKHRVGKILSTLQREDIYTDAR